VKLSTQWVAIDHKCAVAVQFITRAACERFATHYLQTYPKRDMVIVAPGDGTERYGFRKLGTCVQAAYSDAWVKL